MESPCKTTNMMTEFRNEQVTETNTTHALIISDDDSSVTCNNNDNNNRNHQEEEKQENDMTTNKKRTRGRRRGRGSRKNSNASGNVSDSSLSSSDNKSKKAPKKKKNNNSKNSSQQQQQQLQEELLDEEKAMYYAMDCEMVGVGRYGRKSALARVTIVNWDYEIVYDEYVKPTQPITDYRTYVSGITENDMEHAIDYITCQQQVQTLLHGKILIGHALKNDLSVLQITHPWQYIRDTGKYEPFMKIRKEYNDGILWPRKLKELALNKLKRNIQIDGQPHSPYEDAITALDLYKLARNKWEKAMTYKINKTNTIIQQQQQQQHQEEILQQQ